MFGEPKARKRRDHRCKLTEEQEVEIAAAYRSGVSAPELAQQYGYHPAGMWRLLRRVGVVCRSNSEAIRLVVARPDYRPSVTRTLSINEDYFEKADTPQVVRWIGFIAADGCVSERAGGGKQLIVQIQEGDRAHLEALAGCLSYTGNIATVARRRNSCSDMVRLCVCSTKLCDDLIRHGITPRKSLTLQPWGGDPELERFWWGGIVDGDGTVCKPSTNGYIVSFVSGSPHVARAWCDFVGRTTGNCKSPNRGKGNTWQAAYHGTATPYALAGLLYSNLEGSIALARKLATAEEILAMRGVKPYRRQFCWKGIGLRELEAARERHDSWIAVADELGVSPRALWVKLCYLRKGAGAN